jgi:hypothetical protein
LRSVARFRILVVLGILVVGFAAARCLQNRSEPLSTETVDFSNELNLLSESLDSSLGYGRIDYNDFPEAHVPKSYAMILLGDLARLKLEPTNVTLRNRATKCANWLISNRDLDADGIVGWGVPVAWDAYGDGTVNPKDSEYTITTAIVLHALLDFAEQEAPERFDEILQIATKAVAPYLKRETLSPSGLFPYSLESSDRQYDTFNPAAYLAGQLQRLSLVVNDSSLAEKMRSAADSTVLSLVQHRLITKGGVWYWNYSIQESVPNDMPHAVYIIDGLRKYSFYGGRLADKIDLPLVNRHVLDFVPERPGDIRAWPNSRSEIATAVRSYDLGIALDLICSGTTLLDFKSSFIKMVKRFSVGIGGATRYPINSEEPKYINEYGAYLYRGLVSCRAQDLGRSENFDLKLKNESFKTSRERESSFLQLVGTKTNLSTWLSPAFVDLGISDGISVEFNPETWASRLKWQDGTVTELPKGIPLSVKSETGGRVHVIVHKSMPQNDLQLFLFDRKTSSLKKVSRIVLSEGTNPLFRAASLYVGRFNLVYYDSILSSNFIAEYRLDVAGDSAPSLHSLGRPIALPSFGDPAGATYEMVPAIYLFPRKNGLRIFSGNMTVELRDGSLGSPLIFAGCRRIVEVVAAGSEEIAICQSTTDRLDKRPLVAFDSSGRPVGNFGFEQGIPYSFRWQDGVLNTLPVANQQDWPEFLRFEIQRMASSGWLELGENNVEGRIPWSQIYYLNGFLDFLLIAKSDEGFQKNFGQVLKALRQRLDLEISILDRYWREGHFQTKVFTVDRSPALFAVQTSRLLLLFNRYLNEVPDPIDVSSYSSLKAAVTKLESHIEILSYGGESAQWHSGSEPHLRWPKGSKFKFDGLAVPYNHQNEWAYSVWRSHDGSGANSKLALEVISYFVRTALPNSRFPADATWNYWWGQAFDGWRKTDKVSTNMPEYPGDKIKAWISFRSIDTMATLSALQNDGRMNSVSSSAERLVREGGVYPFVAYEFLRSGNVPNIREGVVDEYSRVSAPWELQNLPWAALSRQIGRPEIEKLE